MGGRIQNSHHQIERGHWSDGICSLIQFHPLRPSLDSRPAPASPVSGPAQRSVTLRPTRSPSRHSDPLHQRLQQSRCLHCCSDCYRVERTSSRAGIPPLWTGAFHGARERSFRHYWSADLEFCSAVVLRIEVGKDGRGCGCETVERANPEAKQISPTSSAQLKCKNNNGYSG
jgi:hypothetical protein